MILENKIGKRATMRVRPRLQAGFTLIEIAVVLFIAGLVIAIGMPSVTQSMQQRYARNARDAFVWNANRARARAVQTGRTVLLQVNPGTERAWIVRRNPTAASDTLLTIDFEDEFQSTISTTANTTMTICYSPRGYAYQCDASSPTGTVDVTFTHGVYTAQARVKLLGQVQRL